MIPARSAGRLQTLTALVTGSTAGIGEAIARRLALEGATVAVHGPDLDPARSVAAGIARAGGAAVALAGDLADPGVPAALAAGATELLGHLDILVNNAALKTRADLAATDADTFDRIIGVNLRAPLLLIRALLPHFRAHGGAAIVNIGSVNAHCGAEDLLPYSVSKGGMMTMTRNLADALAGDGIRVNQLNLGWVHTRSEDEIKQAEGFPPDWASNLPPDAVPSGSLLSPEEVAHFVVAFVEPSARRISGAVVDVEQYPLIGRNPARGPGSPAPR